MKYFKEKFKGINSKFAGQKPTDNPPSTLVTLYTTI